MKIHFYKYQGTGNDFIMIDNRTEFFPKQNTQLIKKICDRRFGVGGDGLILLENHQCYDFQMIYYNSDGNESTMCGNGGRCLVAFAHFLNIFERKTTFNAIDGHHEAEIQGSIVKLKMIDVEDIQQINDDYELNTGSPHFVKYVENVENFDVYKNGYEIRNSPAYPEGINVNFVSKIADNEIFVRTYERGVEDETYSCGTGVTASCLTWMKNFNLDEVVVKTLGGNLKVYAEKNENGFKNIWLEGPAKQVFEGHFEFEND
ncbi:MAG: diaminopimelate epimerase [Flavobacteriaceae bacterium]|nr:diaminopimelate epimerase [Flavobacteriaceae bacterium]